MSIPLLIIINGLPGIGKTSLAKRLANDLKLPMIHRDGIAELLFDSLNCQTQDCSPFIAPTSFKLLYYFLGSILEARQSLIVEGCFRFSDLATTEFLQLRQFYDFLPLQIQCVGDGKVILDRYLGRANTPERHIYHHDIEFAERNKEIFLRGRLENLGLDGEIIEIEMTSHETFNYENLLQKLKVKIQKCRAGY